MTFQQGNKKIHKRERNEMIDDENGAGNLDGAAV